MVVYFSISPSARSFEIRIVNGRCVFFLFVILIRVVSVHVFEIISWTIRSVIAFEIISCGGLIRYRRYVSLFHRSCRIEYFQKKKKKRDQILSSLCAIFSVTPDVGKNAITVTNCTWSHECSFARVPFTTFSFEKIKHNTIVSARHVYVPWTYWVRFYCNHLFYIYIYKFSSCDQCKVNIPEIVLHTHTLTQGNWKSVNFYKIKNCKRQSPVAVVYSFRKYLILHKFLLVSVAACPSVLHCVNDNLYSVLICKLEKFISFYSVSELCFASVHGK